MGGEAFCLFSTICSHNPKPPSGLRWTRLACSERAAGALIAFLSVCALWGHPIFQLTSPASLEEASDAICVSWLSTDPGRSVAPVDDQSQHQDWVLHIQDSVSCYSVGFCSHVILSLGCHKHRDWVELNKTALYCCKNTTWQIQHISPRKLRRVPNPVMEWGPTPPSKHFPLDLFRTE